MADKTPDEIRTNMIDVMAKAKPKGLTRPMIEALADATMTGLQRRGIAVVSEDDVLGQPDEHLQTLKSIRRTIREAVDSGETAARDLASLTRRLQDVSREVTTIEERHRAEKRERSGSNGSSAKSGGAPASTESGPLTI